jgi:predicted Na+-dependent transporter
MAFQLDHPTGVALLVVTSSPGGSYSNWWCSLFNADLALSVTMTAISTLLSVVMLPINLLVYTRHNYKDDVGAIMDWNALLLSLVTVILAISSGLYSSAKFGSEQFKLLANRLGNVAGVTLVIISFFMANANKDARIWHREYSFYASVIIPCFCSFMAATLVGTAIQLWKPERVAFAIEVSYQNVGIATSMAISMFQGDERAAAIGVPFFYGTIEACLAFVYCISAWKAGWTKAPASDSFWHMLMTSYEVLEVEDAGKLAPHGESNDYHMVDGTKAIGTELAGLPPIV